MITKNKKREELQLLSQEALDAYMSRPDFQYDADGDALYRRYKDQYTELGKRAMQDTMGQAAALTGGYGSSYAQSVGQQAYQSYLSRVDDVIPELYQLAYQKYQDEGNRLYKTYQSWAQLEQQAAQQEQWEREYELEERKRQDANREFQLEQERKNSQTQTSQTQTAAYHKLGQNNQSRSGSGMSVDEWADLKKAPTVNTLVTMTKTQQTEKFVANTDSWETVARSGNGYENYGEYLKARIDSALSKGQLTQGEAAWLISYYAPDIGESMNDKYTSDRFKQLQKQVMAQLAADVDVSYIESFLTDARAFVLQTEADIRTLTWTADTSDQALNKRNASAQAIKDRANKVRAWLDANKSRISQDAYQQYIQYLDDFSVFLDQSAAQFKRKTAEFSRFETQGQYDQAVQEYEQTRAYQDKYTGMTANQLTAIAASLPQGKEKNWVMAYAAQMPKTKEELQQDLVWARGEYEYLTRVQNEGRKLMALKNQLAATTPDAPGYAELKKQYEDMLRQYPTMGIFEDLDSQITKVKTDIYNMEREIKYFDLSSNADYEEKSRYAGEGERTQQLVNDQESAGKWDTAWTVQKYLPIVPGMETLARVKELWGYENLHLMEEPERKNFNYLYNTQGEDAAKEYLDWLQYTLDARSKQKVQDWVADRTRDVPVLSQVYTSLLSTPIALLSGEGILDAAAQKAISSVSGEWKPVNYNRDGMMASVASSTIRNTVGSDIQEHLGTVAAKAYQLGMGLQDSAAIAGLTIINPALGKMGTMLLGGASATQTMLDAVERGASDEQAIGLGLLSGAFEIFFEKYELDELLDNVKYAVKGAGKGALVKTMARQALSEGVGEGATEIANILADCAVMAEKSNWQMNIEKYITEKNMTPKEAKKQAFIDAALQVGEAVAGGLISGLVSSGAYTGVQTLTKNAGYAKTGATIMDAVGGVEALMNLANQVAGMSSEDVRNMLTSQIDKVSQNPTARNVGQLYATVQAANNQANAAVNQTNTVVKQEDVAKSLRNKGVCSRKVDGLAEAIAARLNGHELTRSQRSFLSFELGSPAVQDVISDIMKKKSDGIDSTLKNAYDEINTIGGNKNGRETALWNLQNQRADGSLPSSQTQTRAEAENRSGIPGTLREIGGLPTEALSATQRRGLKSDLDAFSADDYATVTEGSSLRQVQNAFKEEYGVECYIIKDSSWTRPSPAYSRNGVVYIREGIDLGTLSTAVPHEATHIMKQQSFQPYIDFLSQTPDALNFQSGTIWRLLSVVAKHKNIDPFNATSQQLLSFYDELNSTVYGLHKSGILNSNKFEYREYIPSAFHDFASYIQEMDRLHEEFRNQRNVSAQAKAADGGIDALMNLANEVAGVSSTEMQSMLTSQIDKVSQNPTARNIGQLYTTVQAANNQAKTSAGQSNATPQTMTNQTNTSINRADVAESLKGKGIPSQKIDTLAAAIVARVNGQQLTNTQRSVLSFELGRPSVQKVINELIQKKTNGIDSTQSNGYYKDNVVGGFEAREEAALWDIAKQGADVLGSHDYGTVPDATAPRQAQKAVFEETYEGGLHASFTWKLRGKDVTLTDVQVQEISYVKRNSTELKSLRGEFNKTTRRTFLENLGNNAEYLRNAGFSETDIQKIQNGRVPNGWQVHHKLPLDDSGTNSFDNLVLIQNEPYHKVITNYQNGIARRMKIGDIQTVEWPMLNGKIYPAQH